MLRFHKTPWLVQKILPQFTWRVPSSTNTIYLTFDDGPIPDVTEFVMEQLQKVGAKATFFSVGENLARHPDLATRLVQEGHTLGNHTHNHLSGWDTGLEEYLANVEQCAGQLALYPKQQKLFRPPYGKISRKQVQRLKTEYRLVMWDVLSYDFDPTLSPQQCLSRCLSLTKPGSIVVFHDNVKAVRLLEVVLPRYLEHFASRGFNFAAL